jgi:Xaa-Pro aminopeptidase
MNEELERARAELRRIDADWALLSSSENVTYVSHFEVPVEYGALAAVAYAPSLALLAVNRPTSCLLVPGFYGDWAKEQGAVDEVLVHMTFGGFEPASARDNFLGSLRSALKSAGLGSGSARVAIEERTLPSVALRLLRDEFPNLTLIEGEAALVAARLVKTEREISKLKYAAEVNAAGHTELMKQCQEAGKSDWQIWAAVTRAMQEKAGRVLYVAGELMAGAPWGRLYPGGPSGQITKPGDLALMDISPRVDGYWADNTNTLVVGGVDPSPTQRLYARAALEAFYAAADVLRPGHQACEGFEAVRSTFVKHGLQVAQYAGHQIGTCVNELPRLVAFDETPILPGMVFCIEPAAYDGPERTVGARMEKSVVVRESGPEIFPDYAWGF